MTLHQAPDSSIPAHDTLLRPASGGPENAAWTSASAAPGHFDEFRGVAQQGHAQPLPPSCDWQRFLASLPDVSTHAFDRHQARLQRLMHDNGVSFTAPDDVHTALRPWDINLFPLLLQQDEWQSLARGIEQRMRLLEQILADVYGPQALLQQGWLPPALVQAHPGYLRPMHGIAQERYLHVAAFDLIRDTQGAWWLMAQRTQAPSGLGHLVESRQISRQLFPNGFNQLDVASINEFYRMLLDALRMRCQPLQGDEPLTLVLLTAGSQSPGWFEQNYLARYLGLTLAEGSDLVVRSEKLYIKTLRGLVRVHGMLRRVDDSWMDPLELRPDSQLGVPGLLQVMRAGHVVVANSPGSSFLESPALQGFLPPLCRHLLGEPLQIPALPTWWCGEAAARINAAPHLDQLVIKPTYSGSELHDSFPARLGLQLDARQIAELRDLMDLQGDDFTVQHYMPPSQMPGWLQDSAAPQGRMEFRSLVLRVFAMSHGNGWRVLPGGMARLARQVDGTSLQSGACSADVWITGSAPGEPDLAPVAPGAATTPGTSPLVSRIAENLFWLGRYTERTENAVRLQLLALDSLQQTDRPGAALLGWLQQVLQDQQLLQDHALPTAPDAADTLVQQLAHKWQADDSVAHANVAALARTAAELRGQLPHQHWHLVQLVEQRMPALRADTLPGGEAPLDIRSRLLRQSHALAAVTGVQLDRLQRDQGWHLLMLGRWIERLAFGAGALLPACAGHQSLDRQAIGAIVSLFDPHLQQSRMQSLELPVADAWSTLIASSQHPQSLAWILRQILDSLQVLPPLPFSPVSPAPHMTDNSSRIASLLEDLAACAHDPSGSTTALQQCVHLAIALTDDITRCYFYPVDHASYSVGA